ncbi:MAG: hypothetical protein WAW96_04650 [Alphaproteobacteria bacterium]
MTVSDTTEITGAAKELPAATPAPQSADLPPPEVRWSEGAKAEAAAPAPPHKDQPARRGFAQATMIALLALLLGAAVAALVIEKLRGGGSSDVAQLQSQIEDLRSQSVGLTALNSRLQALEKAGPAGTSDAGLAARLAAVEQSLSTLNASVTGLQSGPPGSGTSGASQQTLSDIKNPLAQLTSRIDTLEKSLASANTSLGERVSVVEQKIPANLSDQLSAAATKTAVDALDKRIVSLEASTTALDAKRAAAAIALANLARAAQSGSKFTDELAAVRLLDVDQSTLTPIEAFADKGVKPVSDIIAAFDPSARAALRASRGEAKDWWSRFWANLAGLFLVRRTGPMSGSSDEAILSRAGDDVHAGNLQAALSEVASLSAPAAKVMAGWREDAQARVDLDKLVNNATMVLIGNLAKAPAH